MTMYLVPLPRLRWYWRATFTAVSTDSPPPSVRNTWLRSPGRCPATLAASFTAGSLAIWKMLDGELLGLLVDGIDDLLPSVTDVDRPEAREGVDVLVTLGSYTTAPSARSMMIGARPCICVKGGQRWPRKSCSNGSVV